MYYVRHSWNYKHGRSSTSLNSVFTKCTECITCSAELHFVSRVLFGSQRRQCMEKQARVALWMEFGEDARSSMVETAATADTESAFSKRLTVPLLLHIFATSLSSCCRQAWLYVWLSKAAVNGFSCAWMHEIWAGSYWAPWRFRLTNQIAWFESAMH